MSLVLGVGITMLAAIVPARRAMAIPPIVAMREGATLVAVIAGVLAAIVPARRAAWLSVLRRLQYE